MEVPTRLAITTRERGLPAVFGAAGAGAADMGGGDSVGRARGEHSGDPDGGHRSVRAGWRGHRSGAFGTGWWTACDGGQHRTTDVVNLRISPERVSPESGAISPAWGNPPRGAPEAGAPSGRASCRGTPRSA